MELSASLKQYFGFEQFRAGQQQTIESLMAGHSAMAIFPTGSGKSLCYQLTALHLPHLTLVVSPLLALIKDQLDFLNNKGINAVSIDSSLSSEQYQQNIQAIKNGTAKILMVSVERFKNERFRHFIEQIPISMMVVDEAHCISEWGHNFRPDYLKLPKYAKQLNISSVLLLTATATKKVKLDMAARFNIQPQHIIQTGFYRSNLDITIAPCQPANKDQQLLNTVQAQSGDGIVYVTLQKTAETLARFLASQGIVAKAYHAGLEDEVRGQIQNDFMAGSIQVVVATIAFGMGVDKSDIRFVIHYDMPKSIENFSQEIGRAGRDGQASNCITLASRSGLSTLENFVYGDTPSKVAIGKVIEDIRSKQLDNSWETQLTSLSNDTNVRQLPLKTLLVQLELLDIIETQYSYFSEFKLKFLQPAQQILSQFNGERAQFLQTVFDCCPVKKTWAIVDIAAIQQAYQTDRERIISALDYLHDNRQIELQSKGATDVYTVKAPDKLDAKLIEQLHQYFTDKQGKEIRRIQAIVRFFELDKCLSQMLAKYFDDNNSPDNCGHCSVCRGHVAHLPELAAVDWPSDQQIKADLAELQQVQMAKFNQPLELETATRFLAGISEPLLTRLRVKKLAGAGSCEAQDYAQIADKVSELLNEL